VLEVELLVKGLEGLGNEVTLEALNTDHQVLLELVLPLHEGFLPSVHTLYDVDLLRHGLLQFLHPLGINCVTVLQILGCSQMGFRILLHVLDSSDDAVIEVEFEIDHLIF
jgi:hypothetical protein